MPIVIARTWEMTPKVGALPQDQVDQAWACIIRNWAKAHPEALKKLTENQTACKP